MSQAPARRTQAERRAQSEERLLRATAELIVRQGLRQTSVTEIAARAGCSHTLVNHLFGSKAGLVERLTEVVERYYWEKAVGSLRATSGLDGLIDVTLLYLELVADDDPLGRVNIVRWGERLTVREGQGDARPASDAQFRQAIADFLAQGIAAGEIRPDLDVPSVTTVVLGLLRGVAAQLLFEIRSADEVDRVRETTVALVRSMLSAR